MIHYGNVFNMEMERMVAVIRPFHTGRNTVPFVEVNDVEEKEQLPYKYVLSEQLGFVNVGLTIKVWGPASKENVIAILRDNGHRLGSRPHSDTILPCIAYCMVCGTSVAVVLDEYYMGYMLDAPCNKRT